ncbi:MAG TPA: histidine--tRNA ligase [Thermoplasmata archaeon]|nr:histidine--tRNA ligase [Thermoplasmata archaeon]
MAFERPRGTNDWGPEDMAKRRFVESAFVRTAAGFGFREIQTPIFESLDLFTAKSGPGVVEELYAFKDKGGRDIALRPEFTAPILRFYVAELRSLPKPVKVYCYGPAFRYEEPQKGRYREFEQLDAEIIGGATLASDAEVIALAIETMRAIGLKQIKARIGHIGMLRAFLPFGPADQARVLHALDKKNFPALEDELRRLGQSELVAPLRRMAALHGDAAVLDEAQTVLGGKGTDAFGYLKHVATQLSRYGILPSEYEFDMGVVRGLDYYTGLVFELDSPNLGAEKQVGGGGAYMLAELFGGEPVAQTGFALGVDRLVLAAEAENVFPPTAGIDAYIVPIGESTRGRAVEILTTLRAAGLQADIDLVGRGPSKNLDYANATRARFAVLVGERELKAEKVGLRNLKTGEQREVPVGILVEEIRAAEASSG